MGGAAAGPGVIPGMAPGAFPGVMPGVQLPGPPSVGGGGVDGMATPIPTPFLGVNGMITADVLDNDEEYKEVRGCGCGCVIWLCVTMARARVCVCLHGEGGLDSLHMVGDRQIRSVVVDKGVCLMTVVCGLVVVLLCCGCEN